MKTLLLSLVHSIFPFMHRDATWVHNDGSITFCCVDCGQRRTIGSE